CFLFSTDRHRTYPTSFPYTTLFRSHIEIAPWRRLRRIPLNSGLSRHRRRTLPEPRVRVLVAGCGKIPADVILRSRRRRRISAFRSEEHTSELQSRVDLVCRLLLEKK